MATVDCNGFVNGISGMMGRSVVFRRLHDRTIITKRPAAPTRESEQQKANRNRFREATVFAKAAMQDGEKKEYYRRRAKKLNLPNAYTAAITDYMRKPMVSVVKKHQDFITVSTEKRGFPLKRIMVITNDHDSNVATGCESSKEIVDGRRIVLHAGDMLKIEDGAGITWRFDSTPLFAAA